MGTHHLLIRCVEGGHDECSVVLQGRGASELHRTPHSSIGHSIEFKLGTGEGADRSSIRQKPVQSQHPTRVRAMKEQVKKGTHEWAGGGQGPQRTKSA